MKKFGLFAIIFIASFLVAYLIICYLPGMRIKLFADPMEYFVASIKHNMGFKTLASLIIGLFVSVPSLLLNKKIK